jgi:hypothetical protein
VSSRGKIPLEFDELTNRRLLAEVVERIRVRNGSGQPTARPEPSTPRRSARSRHRRGDRAGKNPDDHLRPAIRLAKFDRNCAPSRSGCASGYRVAKRFTQQRSRLSVASRLGVRLSRKAKVCPLKPLFNGEPFLMSSLYSCHLEFFHSREVDSREAFCIAADCAPAALPRSRGLAPMACPPAQPIARSDR